MLIGEALVDCFADATVPGGAPFNVARSLGAFGIAPVMITRLGNDTPGKLLRKEFRRFGLPMDGVQTDSTRPSGQVEVTTTATGHTFTIAENAAWDAIDADLARSLVDALSPSIICFGTLAQRSALSRAAVNAVLNETQALRVLDLNLRDGADSKEIAEWSMQSADVLKVNDVELDRLLGWFVLQPGSTAAWGSVLHLEAIAHLIAKFSLTTLVVTRGEHGYAAFDADARLVAAGEPVPTTIVDTVGAGDAFLAILILGQRLAWPIAMTLARANLFAADVCTLRGAVADNMAFYARWATRWNLSKIAAYAADSPSHQLTNA